MSRAEVISLRVRGRLAEIADRLGELRARGREAPGGPQAPAPPAAGPAGDRSARAASRARQARAHAADAAWHARQGYLDSAQVHDRAADFYDQLAAARPGDATRCHRAAQRHRGLAAADRTAAGQREG